MKVLSAPGLNDYKKYREDFMVPTLNANWPKLPIFILRKVCAFGMRNSVPRNGPMSIYVNIFPIIPFIM